MVPITRNLLHHEDKSSGKSCYFDHPGKLEASAPAVAARQDHRNPSRSPRLAMADDDPAAAAGSSSSPAGLAGAGDDEGDWLQLGLAAAASSSSASSSGENNSTGPAPPPMELDLFACYDKPNAGTRPPLFPLPLRSYQSYGRGRYRPAPATGRCLEAPFMPPFRSSGDSMRVISPPRRTEAAGLWLTLQAAPNQIREPILPQIPKSYLRIKDSNMKVEVVIKYLAEKLGIAPSHQVELTCRGQLLPPSLLLKYVRDSIWCSSAPREHDGTPAHLTTAYRRLPPAATTDHVMTLCYGTSRNSKLVLHL
ncbi:hypothetical protein BS78_03G390700 [Paspalum vaginatum]|nr:hypothetical protein BS78_03G390700 [Paspalum vaginatum]